MKTKVCSECHLKKSILEFYTNRFGNPRAKCKTCEIEISTIRQSKWREDDPEGYRIAKVKQSRKYLYRLYGLTEAQVEEMGENQDWKCYICGVDISTKPYVDHNHRTMMVRKLLCLKCNSGLGYFGDSIVLLENALAYLIEHDD